MATNDKAPKKGKRLGFYDGIEDDYPEILPVMDEFVENMRQVMASPEVQQKESEFKHKLKTEGLTLDDLNQADDFAQKMVMGALPNFSTRGEFIADQEASAARHKTTREKAFALADADHDGKLNEAEYHSYRKIEDGLHFSDVVAQVSQVSATGATPPPLLSALSNAAGLKI